MLCGLTGTAVNLFDVGGVDVASDVSRLRLWVEGSRLVRKSNDKIGLGKLQE